MAQTNAIVPESEGFIEPPQTNPVVRTTQRLDDISANQVEQKLQNEDEWITIEVKIRRSNLKAILGLLQYPLQTWFARIDVDLNSIPNPDEPNMSDLEHATAQDVASILTNDNQFINKK